MNRFKKNKNFITASITLVVLIFGIIFSLFSNQTQKAKAAWYNNSWNYRQKIIIDHNKVPNTDQADFPVLIKITDTSNPIFSSKVQDDGDDIRFTSTDQTTTLNHEIESYSKTNHELWAWVKVPTLSHENDTTIYLYYGNTSAPSLSTAEKQAVWSNGYAGVWHGADTTTSTISDSAASAYTGNKKAANEPVQSADGKISFSQSLDGSDDSIAMPGLDSYMHDKSSVTISAWFSSDTVTGNNHIAGWHYNRYGALWLDGSGAMAFTYQTTGGTNNLTKSWSFSSDHNWHHIVGTYDATGGGKLYVDGISVNSTAANGNIQSQDRFAVGAQTSIGGAATGRFDGKIDQVTASSSAKSADWIATEYANQNSPETFAFVSSEISKTSNTYLTQPTGWYDYAWNSRQPIIFENTKVANTDQSDFPVFFKLTNASNDLWTRAQADGDDVLFADSSGNKLAHEIEKYDALTHELLAWVKVPTLSTATDTTIYMYYGNGSSANQQSASAVWSNGYAGVWHLPNGTALSPLDSTKNYNLTNTGPVTAAPGKFFGGVNGFAAGKGLTATAGTSVNSTDWTAEGWIYRTATPSYSNTILGHGQSGASAGHWMFYTNSSNKLDIDLPYVKGSVVVGNTTVAQGQWSHVVATKSGNIYTVYYNGSLDGTATDPVANVVSGNLFLGNTGALNHPFLGSLDEMRISSSARSADWIATQFNNQSSPETFMQFGTAETADSFAPSNPTTITSLSNPGGDPLGNNGNDSTPYYSWPEPEVAGGSTDQTGDYVSGVAGYYSYFGASCGAGGADPAATRGFLADTGSGIHYSSDANVSVSDLGTSEGVYCLRLRTKDITGNVSATTEVATYNFDSTNPNAPTFVSVNPAGFSLVDSFDFAWPVATDVAGSGSSGIQGYQYRRGGNSGDEWGTLQTETTVAAIKRYQDGANIFQIRSVDNAGNVSADVQTTYYYSSAVPTKPTSIIATPALSETNSFAFSWTAPSHSVPISEYGFSINAEPTAQNITWTGSNSTSLSADSYATLQGDNTIYIVAKDASGAYGLAVENYGTATFNCTTVAPPIPTGASVSDSSNRTIDLWTLTIKWSAGVAQDTATFDHYSIERSTDNNNFSQIATTSSTAYIDSTGLNNSTTYYYQIKAVDNAGSTSAPSSIISKMPTGKFATPPTIVTSPTSTATATAATISWVVNRASTSAVKFGKSESDLSRSQIDSTEKTSQSISLVGLEPGTEYYYQVQSLDNYRDYSSESAYSSTYKFTTLAAPGIANVLVSNINLNSSDISWETTSASNTKVHFGTSISYGTVLPEINESKTTKHTVKLDNLTHTTKYHFKIEGDDIDGNHLSSDDYTFETLPLPKISNISYIPDFTGPAPQVTISWVTNVATTSSVNYTPVSPEDAVSFEESQSALVKEHKVNLAKMKNDTDYRFVISGRDQFGNLVQSDSQILKTGADSRPPSISEVNVETSNIGLNSRDRARIIISWKTDEPSTGEIEYDEGISGTSYRKKIQADPGLSTDHVVIISDLKPQSPYHFRVIAKDKEGNKGEDIDRTVISGEISQSVFNIIVETLTNLFGWLGKVINF